MVTISNQGLDLATNNPVPSFKQKKSTIYRLRNKHADVTKTNTRSISEVEVPQQFRSFLLADYSHIDMRILIFCSAKAKTIIPKTKHFFMDGTFKSSPQPFQQLFTIHGDLGSDTNNINVIALIYAFMTHRTEKAYSVLFNLIKAQIPEFHPIKVTVDYEEGVMKALQNMHVEVKGCHYHFTNSLWRKARTLKLTKSKMNRRVISLTCNLAHLPEEKIALGWEYIKNEITLLTEPSDFYCFIAYFENYWMRNDFMKMWCVCSERHRTNNAVEGWNHYINTRVNKNEINLLQVLHVLLDDASVNRLRVDKLMKFNTSSQPKRRKTDITRSDYILNAHNYAIDIG